MSVTTERWWKNTAFWLLISLFMIGMGLALFLGNSDDSKPGLSNSQRNAPDSVTRGHIPRRIICMAPNITETVFMLGSGDRVVGVADFTTYPPEAADIPRVGGFIDPNFEKLAALDPDLIIIQGNHERVHDYCLRKGIPYCSVNMDSLVSIYAGIRTIGDAIGKTGESQAMVLSIQRKLTLIKDMVRKEQRPRVFFSLGRRIGSLAGLFTTGNSGFLGELLDIAGGDNVFSSLTTFYPQVSRESIIQRSPEIIIEAMYDIAENDELISRAKMDWNDLPMLPAVKSGHIVILTAKFLQVPGPRIAETAGLLSSLLHPDLVSPLSESERSEPPSSSH